MSQPNAANSMQQNLEFRIMKQSGFVFFYAYHQLAFNVDPSAIHKLFFKYTHSILHVSQKVSSTIFRQELFTSYNQLMPLLIFRNGHDEPQA